MGQTAYGLVTGLIDWIEGPSSDCGYPRCPTEAVVCAAIARLYADAAYDSAENRSLCLREGILPLIRKGGVLHGSGLGAVRCVVEHANASLLANKRLDHRNDRSIAIIDGLLTAACIFVIANRSRIIESRASARLPDQRWDFERFGFADPESGEPGHPHRVRLVLIAGDGFVARLAERRVRRQHGHRAVAKDQRQALFG